MIKIIEYNKQYKEQIPILFTNTIHKTCNKEYTKEQLNAWASLKIDFFMWEQRVERTKPFLAIFDKELVGFVEFYDEYIDCFYVHHKYQGLGVGKRLLNHVLNLAKKRGILKIRVDASITAKPFFETFGFVEVRENIVLRDACELTNYSMERSL